MKNTEKPMLRQCLIIAVSIIINLVGRYLAQEFQLPFWLDTIGTCIAVYYTNVFGGIISAVTVNTVFGFSDHISMIYMLVGIVLTLLMRLCAKKGYFESFIPAMMSSFGIGLLAAVVSTPIDIIFYEGRAGNVWGDALFEMLQFYGYPTQVCTFAGECFINIVDKQISVLIVYALMQICKMRKDGYVKTSFNLKKISAFGVALILTLSVLFGVSNCLLLEKEQMVPKESNSSFSKNLIKEDKYIDFNDYVKVIYNGRNGLPSSEANAIAQTPDGYIWIGGYAGLSRYDGTHFEYITEGGLSNVTTMLTDRSGRLWIGTNDHGIAVYENGNMKYITKEDGITADSIRSLYEDKNGIIYAGTTDSLVSIDRDYTVHVVKGAPEGVVSVAVHKDYIVGIDSNLRLFAVKEGNLVFCRKCDSDDYTYYTLLADDEGVYVGTTGSLLLKMSVDNEGIHIEKSISCGSLHNITNVQKTKEGVIWLSGDNGLGYLNENDTIHILNYSGFDSSIEYMMQDYEGNYWFASSRFGVMKLCKNIFTNIHESADQEGIVVNAVTAFQGDLYCGTDSGLQIIDPETYEFKKNKLIDFIGNVRVRCVSVDSNNCLWICCYDGPGLVCVKPDGEILTYNEKKDKTAGDRFRCVLELQDGTIAVGSSNGITFIKDGVVTGTLSQKNGLKTEQILSMVQTSDGTLYAGSDGSGIYVIKDGKVVDTITKENGLSSLIILRMAVYGDACFVVTSNSIGVMENNTVRTIKSFPYFNNFDVIIRDNEAWVLTSRGIYIADVRDLMADNFKYTLYDYSNGLLKSITANAWTYIDENDVLYFCTNEGVEKISMDRVGDQLANYKMQITSVMADEHIVQEKDGVYTIDSTANRISITPAICNYRLNDLKVCVCVEGLDEKKVLVRQSQLDTLNYTNVPGGTYTVHMQIFSDMDEKMIQEKTYTIVKKARMWENAYFKLYLYVILLGEVFFFAWVIINIRQIFKRRKELEHRKQELEERVREQTAEIREQAGKMEKMQWGVIEGMASLIESRDGNTGEHVINTREYVKLLSTELYKRGMYPDVINEKFVKTITQIAPLHDVGKIKISDVILNKPGRFTPEEFEIMKQHTVMGGEIVGDIIGKEADPYMLQMAKEVATYHHEKWDGSGYPCGLSGEDIPLPARIMAVADVFDAIISKRVYKEAMETEEGFAELERCAGAHFDAELVKVFLEIKKEVVSYCDMVKKN